jgi:hypothetical protein
VKVGPSRSEWVRPGCKGAAKGRILEVFKRAATPQTGQNPPERRRGDFRHGLLGSPPWIAPRGHGNCGSEKALLMKTAIAPRVTGFSGQ